MEKKEMTLNDVASEVLLDVIWNIALADSRLSEEELLLIEQISHKLGLSSDLLENPVPLEEILNKIAEKDIQRAIYSTACQMAYIDQEIDPLEQELLNIIKEHFAIPDDECKRLESTEYIFITLSDTGKEEGDWAKAASALGEAGKLSLKAIIKLSKEARAKAKQQLASAQAGAKDLLESAKTATSKEVMAKYSVTLKQSAEATWTYMKDSQEKAAEKYKNMSKSKKILAFSAMAGGAIISVPFIIAAGPLSIVSALAALGLGSLAAGGFGVAGGIVVTGVGIALSASLAAAVANKYVKDPEVEKLIEGFSKLEGIIKQNFTVMEKHQQQYKKLYEKYGKIAEFTAQLQKKIESEEKYNIEAVRENNFKINDLIEDLEAELAGGNA